VCSVPLRRPDTVNNSSGRLSIPGPRSGHWCADTANTLAFTRLAISRVLIYGLLSACVIAVYLAVTASVGAVASDVVGAPVAALAAVLVALPLRDVLARGANRLVYGYRDDPYRALVRLGQRLEDAAVPEDVLPAVARTVRDALRIPYVEIEIRGSTTTVGGPQWCAARKLLPGLCRRDDRRADR
jgi:two-component system, NarL family, sensor kinase